MITKQNFLNGSFRQGQLATHYYSTHDSVVDGRLYFNQKTRLFTLVPTEKGFLNYCFNEDSVFEKGFYSLPF